MAYDDYDYEPIDWADHPSLESAFGGIEWTPELDFLIGHAEYAGHDLDDPSYCEQVAEAYQDLLESGFHLGSDEWIAFYDLVGYEDVDWSQYEDT